ncbi:MAG: alpha-L-fucosidase [Armatimonadetes bacterium]|nr:alpha-L-fucosidase [Armatimonadota bacterium]
MPLRLALPGAMLLIAAMTAHAEQAPPRPTPVQAAWQEMELGMFIHYDMNVFKPGWDHRQYATRPGPELFNPARLNTDQWLEAARAMGAKYAVLTAKHGSGFMLWQSDLYPFGMKQSPFQNGQGDIVRDFVRSCRKFGIKPGIYAHMGCNGYLEVDNPGLVNRGRGGTPDEQARYARICEGMLNELWGRYGKLAEIWFDGGVLDPDKGGPDMLSILRKRQPNATVFQGPAATIRWIGNEDGVAPYPCWATVPAERDYAGTPTASAGCRASATCRSVRASGCGSQTPRAASSAWISSWIATTAPWATTATCCSTPTPGRTGSSPRPTCAATRSSATRSAAASADASPRPRAAAPRWSCRCANAHALIM